MGDDSLAQFDGSYRICHPQETFRAIQPVLAMAGITRLADVTKLDLVGLPTWQAIRPRAVTLSVSQGKGLTHDEARVSAAMESLERFAWERFHPPLIWKSILELGTDQIADPTKFADMLLGGSSHHAILPWCEAHSLLTGRDVLVVADLVCVQRYGSHRKIPRWAHASSNGLAAGNSIEEATLHALFEVIERDAQTCAEHALKNCAIPRPRIAIRQIGSSVPANLFEQVRQAGLELELFSNENPFEIPCYTAYLIDERGFFPTNVGSGAHLDPTVAMARAVTEAAQGRITMISASREDNFRAEYKFFDEVASVLFQRARYERSITPTPVQLPEVPPVPSLVNYALNEVVQRMCRTGIDDILRIDMTDCETQVPVVKVLVPGLCGYHFPIDERIDAYYGWLAHRPQS